jgi:hypothetical protein
VVGSCLVASWEALSCGDIDGQMGRVWRADLRHDPFNSACTSSA